MGELSGRSVRVHQDVLARAKARAAASTDCKVPAPTPAVSGNALSGWLMRLEAGRQKGGDVNAAARKRGERQPLKAAAPNTYEMAGGAPAPSGRAAATWLAKLRQPAPELQGGVSAESAAEMPAYFRRCVDIEVERHCQMRTAFLRGPRQLRQQFGSVLDGTDQTADVVLDAATELQTEAVAAVADFCRRSREARSSLIVESTGREDSDMGPTPNRTRAEALAALWRSDRLLRACGVLAATPENHEEVAAGAVAEEEEESPQEASASVDVASVAGDAEPDSPRSLELRASETKLQQLLGLCDTAAARCIPQAVTAAAALARLQGRDADLVAAQVRAAMEDTMANASQATPWAMGCQASHGSMQPVDVMHSRPVVEEDDAVDSKSEESDVPGSARRYALEALQDSAALLAQVQARGWCDDSGGLSRESSSGCLQEALSEMGS
eukprot:TRINITY_DN23029_c0_g5_i2.p2 TRINITY_DN23029_c0_g5~~TRINITY_DN23029_c0_g5_i2.p2  ORF type:complete len:441 (-),score=107.57 TRINITY_DN23029_c0_g5_i2:1614-2936(-)